MPDLTPLVGMMPDAKTIALLFLLWVLSALLSGLLAKKTQIDAWVEARPRIGGVLKLLRGVGLDPWLVIQGASLIVKGRLPTALREARTKAPATSDEPPPSSHTLPGASTVMLFLFAVLCMHGLAACSSAPPPGPCEAKLANYVRECRARIKAECDHHPDGTPVESCTVLKDCDAGVNAWKGCR